MSLANLPLNTGETRRLIGSPRADATLRMMRGAQPLPGGLMLPSPGQSYEGLAQALAERFQDPLQERVREVRDIMRRDIRNVGVLPYGDVFSPLALMEQQLEQGKISPPDRVPQMNAYSLALTMDPDFQRMAGKLPPVLQRVLRQTAARGMLRNQGVPEAELYLGQDVPQFERSDPGRMRSIFENVFRQHGDNQAYLETFAARNPEVLRQLQKIYAWSTGHPAFQEFRGEGDYASRSSYGALPEVYPRVFGLLRDAGGRVETTVEDAIRRIGYLIDRDRYAPSGSLGPLDRNVPATQSQLMMVARALGVSPEEVVANPDRFLQAIQEFYQERSQAGIERALGQDPSAFMEFDRTVTGGSPNVAGAVRSTVSPGNAYAPFNPGGFPETPYRMTPETERAVARRVPESFGELRPAQPRPQAVVEPAGAPSLLDFLDDNDIEVEIDRDNLRNRGRAIAVTEMARSINSYRYMLQQARSAPGFDALGREASAIGALETELTSLLDDIRSKSRFNNADLGRLFNVMRQVEAESGDLSFLMRNELFREIHRDIGARFAGTAYAANKGAMGYKSGTFSRSESSDEISNAEKRRRNRASNRLENRRTFSSLYQQEVRPKAQTFADTLGLRIPGSGFSINTRDPDRARQVDSEAALDRGPRSHLFKMTDPEATIDLMQKLHDRLHAQGKVQGPRLDVREQLALWESNRSPSLSDRQASSYPDSTFENTVHPEVLRRLFGIDLSRLGGLEGTVGEKYRMTRDDRNLLTDLNREAQAIKEGKEPAPARPRNVARDDAALASRRGGRSLPNEADTSLPPNADPLLFEGLGNAIVDDRMAKFIRSKIRSSKDNVIVLADRDMNGFLKSPNRLKEFLTIVTGRKLYTEEGGRTHFTVVDQAGKPFTGFRAGEERVGAKEGTPVRSEDRRTDTLFRLADAIDLDPSLALVDLDQLSSRTNIPIEMLADVLQSMGPGEGPTGGGASGGAFGDGLVARLRAMRGVRLR